MVATSDFVKEKFDFFNGLCFEGALPAIPVVMVKARTFLGKVEYVYNRGFFGRITGCRDFRMKISVSFDLEEAVLEDVILHEMIHYYIALNRIKDSSAHGHVFREMMDSINEKYGRNITVRHRADQTLRPVQGPQASGPDAGLDGGPVAVPAAGSVCGPVAVPAAVPVCGPTSEPAEAPARQNYVCVSTFRDGKLGVTVCSASKIQYLKRVLPRYFSLEKMEWYTSRDPFFNRFPRARTPKIYKITRAELDAHLRTDANE